MLKSVALAISAMLCVGIPGAWAQSVYTQNLNQTGIPRNAPSLGLGQIYGLNPCATGATAGVTTPLFGVAGAISDIDRECETRNNAAVVITGLKDDQLAKEILCGIKDIREAAIRIGKPCLEDQRRISKNAPPVASAAVVTPAPAPVAVQRPVVPTLALKPNAPAFCKVTDLDLKLYPECLASGMPETTTASVPRPRPPARHRAQTRTEPNVGQIRRHEDPVAKVEPRCGVNCLDKPAYAMKLRDLLQKIGDQVAERERQQKTQRLASAQ